MHDSLLDKLADGLSALPLELNGDVQHRLIDYVQLLVKWNRAYNLTAVRQPEQMVTRHLLDSLLRKPGGFRNYRYREALFPGLLFRQSWEQFNQWYTPRKADLIYLRILRLAVRHSESEVAAALSLLLANTTRWDDLDVEQLLQPQRVTATPKVPPPQINLSQYDRLLQEVCGDSA